LPAIFDSARAERVLQGFAALNPDVAAGRDTRAIIASVAGNSPYLGGLILKEHAFTARLLTEGPESQIERLIAAALGAADAETLAAAQSGLRIAKRRFAL